MSDDDIRYDMSQFYSMKSVLEDLLGRATYEKLKETGNLRDWKVASTKLLKAIDLSISETVQISDAEWRTEIGDVLELGRRLIAGSKNIADLFAALSATLTRLVFLQIGWMPRHGHRHRVVPLSARNWKLDGVRTVQYVQNAQQKASLKRAIDAKRKI